MKLPLLWRSRKDLERTAAAAQDQSEKLLADSFRLLSQLCAKLADMVESQRLQRNGYERQERYLERIDGAGKDPK